MHEALNSGCNVNKTERSVKLAWKRNIFLLMDYVERNFHIMTVVLIAELVRRIFRIFYEYIKYPHYYEPQHKLMSIITRSFGMGIPSRIGLIAYLFVAVVCVMKSGIRLPVYFFMFMPLYWGFMAFGMGTSDFQYTDMIREPHGLDYAEGMASNYFHGYLKLILPTQTDDIGLKERMELYENQHRIKFAKKRLFILVPNTMFISSKIESRMLTKDGVMPLETIVKNRAGVARPFKNDVYRFNIPINGSYYYIALEGATPLLSFFESLSFQPSVTWQMKEFSREILLKFYKRLKYLLNNWPETQGRAELVLYNSYKSDGRPQDVGEVLFSLITNMVNEEEH